MNQLKRLTWLLPMMGNSTSKEKEIAANNIVNNSIFNLAHFKNIYVDIDKKWGTENQSRSLRRWLHTHIFLDDFIEAYKGTKEKHYFDESFKILNDWFVKFPPTEINNIDPLAYHDEGSAQRLLFWLKYYYAFYNCFDDYQLRLFKNKIDETANLLSEDKFYAGLNNHGMFQDMSIVAYSIYKFENFHTVNLFNKSIDRILYYFEQVFTHEGVHKEHAPSYHILLLYSLKKFLITLDKARFQDQRIEFLRNIMVKGEKYILSIVTPEFKLPNISDSSELTLGGQYKDIFDSQEYKYISSMGKKGEAPTNLINVFPESGYLIARNKWNKNALYFVFIAAYHVRYHKHSDDLSFLLYKKIPIFVDAGPYSYNYKDPMTTYAYSQYAHSSLIVNEESLPRTDKKYEKVYISENKIDEKNRQFNVVAVNERYEKVTHCRRIIGNLEKENFIITDNIISKDKNKYELLFQINGILKVIIEKNIVNIYDKNDNVAKLEILNHSGVENINIDLVREQNQPKLMGYQFPKKEVIEPMNTLIISFHNMNDLATIHTEINLLI